MVRARQFVLVMRISVRVFDGGPYFRFTTHIVRLVYYGFVTGQIVSVGLVKSDPSSC